MFGALHAESAQAFMVLPGLPGGVVEVKEASMVESCQCIARPRTPLCALRDKPSEVLQAPGELKAIAGEVGAKPPHH